MILMVIIRKGKGRNVPDLTQGQDLDHNQNPTKENPDPPIGRERKRREGNLEAEVATMITIHQKSMKVHPHVQTKNSKIRQKHKTSP